MLRERVGVSCTEGIPPSDPRRIIDEAERTMLGRPSGLDPDILPNKQPLSVRLHEYHRRALESLSSLSSAQAHIPPGPATAAPAAAAMSPLFSPGTAMDRFRDIPPGLVMAVFEGDMAVLEPGSVGPLPLGHPILAELIDCINRRYVTPGILLLILSATLDQTGAAPTPPTASPSPLSMHRLSHPSSEHQSSPPSQHGGNQAHYHHPPHHSPHHHHHSSGHLRRQILYDGGLVVGILDYRRSVSFTTTALSSTSSNAAAAAGSGTGQAGLLGAMAAQGIAPEMHKVFLKAGYAALAVCFDHDYDNNRDLEGPSDNLSSSPSATPPSCLVDEELRRLESEAECLRLTNGRLCLDPDPSLFATREWAMYDRDKLAWHCASLLDTRNLPKTRGDAGQIRQYQHMAGQTASKTHSRGMPPPPPIATEPVPLAKLRQLAALDDTRARGQARDAEAFLGIDQRRNLARTRSPIPSTVLNHPGQRVWRTLRFEREAPPDSALGRLYYSVNILAIPGGGGAPSNTAAAGSSSALSSANMSATPSFSPSFEVVLRCGSVPDTAQGPHGFCRRFVLPSLMAVEHYLVTLKQLLSIEDCQRRLTVDVANPSVLVAPPHHQPPPQPRSIPGMAIPQGTPPRPNISSKK